MDKLLDGRPKLWVKREGSRSKCLERTVLNIMSFAEPLLLPFLGPETVNKGENRRENIWVEEGFNKVSILRPFPEILKNSFSILSFPEPERFCLLLTNPRIKLNLE